MKSKKLYPKTEKELLAEGYVPLKHSDFYKYVKKSKQHLVEAYACFHKITSGAPEGFLPIKFYHFGSFVSTYTDKNAVYGYNFDFKRKQNWSGRIFYIKNIKANRMLMYLLIKYVQGEK